MKKKTTCWKISDLKSKFHRIDFPEYQREPTVWHRSAKQRLVDSISRGFDISSIYLYNDGEDGFECVDGRQRISAIMAFLGELDSSDAGFQFQVMNEIYEDLDSPFSALNGKSFQQIEVDAENCEIAKDFIHSFMDYPVAVVELSRIRKPEDFNLQFSRLNLGVIINSGEKLNAMIGNLRDACFDRLAHNSFLSSIEIPTRRFAREQLAAQIAAQVFSIESSKANGQPREFTRVRHTDLQSLFKIHTSLSKENEEWISRIEDIMNNLAKQQEEFPILRSRSIVLSLFLLAYERSITEAQDAKNVALFAKEFMDCLKKQLGKIQKGHEVSEEYRYMIDFQKHLSQGSVQKIAIQSRADCLERCFDHWRAHDHALPTGEQLQAARGV